MYLVHAAEHIERRYKAEYLCAEFHDLRCFIKEGNKRRRENKDRYHKCDGAYNSHRDSGLYALFGSVDLIHSQILANESGIRKRYRLHRQKQELVNFCVCRPAAHAGFPEMVDIGLYKNI